MNLIESFFGKMGKQCLKGIRVKFKEEPKKEIYQNIAEVNEYPVVYHWDLPGLHEDIWRHYLMIVLYL